MYSDFEIKSSSVFNDVKVISPDVFRDKRGFIFTDYLETFFQKEFNPALKFLHSKNAFNYKKVIRGIHGDFDTYKLVQCLFGEVFQVIVDCRKESRTYLKYDSFLLSYNDPKMILIPPGFGNAFAVMSEYAIYNYKLAYSGSYNDYDKQFTHKWNDKRININWPVNNPVLSKRDK